MNKEVADRMIEKYIYKIYGFSLTKTMNIDIAEELASNITFEVYKSFLKSAEISNLDGFVWKLACNVYSQFVAKEVNHKCIHQNINEDNDNDVEEFYERIRYEIAFLSKIQREVILLHYFDKLKITEIAERLSLSLGTVKWHLHEARNSLKSNYLDESEIMNKPHKPIFTEMINLGYTGSWGIKMDHYFQRNLSQNIVLSAYHGAKTSVEIAKELRVPVVFIEDEINHLMENGFLTQEPNSKYSTNFCIIKPVNENWERVKEYAKIVCEIYIPLIDIKALTKNKEQIIYTPNQDMNFLLWSIITYACSRKLRTIDERDIWGKYFVKRRDGGDYIAIAKIDEDKTPQKDNEYKNTDSITYLNPDVYPICYWEFHSKFDERKYSRDNENYQIFETFYDFIIGKLSREPKNIYKYKLLFDKGLIVSKGNTEIANVIISKLSLERFEELLPEIPDKLKMIGTELDEIRFEESKSIYAPQMKELGRALNINSLAGSNIRVAILNYLLDIGILKPLKKNQKLSVNTIMFCDKLPDRG